MSTETEFYRLKECNVAQKRVLVRVDFNVPVDASGKVQEDTRIRAALETICFLRDAGAKVILMSHLGRPKGKPEARYSLAPVAAHLAEQLGQGILFVEDCIGEKVSSVVSQLQPGSILLLENLRFHAGETENDPQFAQALADLADVYVNDAFGAAHRAHASTVGVAERVPQKAMGFLMKKELHYLEGHLKSPQRPFVVVLGGAKVSDKIGVIDALLDKADTLLIGGAMAYTFALAQGRRIGKSLCEPDKIHLAQAALKKAQEKGVQLLLPTDNWVTQHLDFDAGTVDSLQLASGDLPDGWEGVDIGPETLSRYQNELAGAKTVLWNGPMGVFEVADCQKGTFGIAQTLAQSQAVTLVGGGDSVRAIHESGCADRITFISTGGGASLELLEGKVLPGVEALRKP